MSFIAFIDCCNKTVTPFLLSKNPGSVDPPCTHMVNATAHLERNRPAFAKKVIFVVGIKSAVSFSLIIKSKSILMVKIQFFLQRPNVTKKRHLILGSALLFSSRNFVAPSRYGYKSQLQACIKSYS